MAFADVVVIAAFIIRTRQRKRNLEMMNHTTARVNSYKYLGTVVRKSIEVGSDIKAKLVARIKSYFAVQKLPRFRTMSRCVKLTI